MRCDRVYEKSRDPMSVIVFQQPVTILLDDIITELDRNYEGSLTHHQALDCTPGQ